MRLEGAQRFRLRPRRRNERQGLSSVASSSYGPMGLQPQSTIMANIHDAGHPPTFYGSRHTGPIAALGFGLRMLTYREYAALAQASPALHWAHSGATRGLPSLQEKRDKSHAGFTPAASGRRWSGADILSGQYHNGSWIVNYAAKIGYNRSMNIGSWNQYFKQFRLYFWTRRDYPILRDIITVLIFAGGGFAYDQIVAKNLDEVVYSFHTFRHAIYFPLALLVFLFLFHIFVRVPKLMWQSSKKKLNL